GGEVSVRQVIIYNGWHTSYQGIGMKQAEQFFMRIFIHWCFPKLLQSSSVCVGLQKLIKGKRADDLIFNSSHRNFYVTGKRGFQQGTGSDYMKLRHLFKKVAEYIDRLGYFLNFINEQQCLADFTYIL